MKKRKLMVSFFIFLLLLQSMACNNALRKNETKNEKKDTKEAELFFSDDKKSVIGVSDRTFVTYAVIPEGVTSIGCNLDSLFGSFEDCRSLTSVTIPESVTVIDYGAFRNCEKLADITIPNNLVWIGIKAFENCKSLEEFEIPKGVPSIEEGAFRGCKSLTDITIPDNVRKIGEEAFADCRSLKKFEIPESVTKIGKDVFKNCFFTKKNFKNSSLLKASKNHYWGANIIDSDDGGICVKDKIVVCVRPDTCGEIIIKEGIKGIRKGAFADCSSKLTSIKLPDSIVELEGGVGTASFETFSGCNSQTIITWKGITCEIDNYYAEYSRNEMMKEDAR